MGIKNWYVELSKIKESNEAYMAYLMDKRRHPNQSIDILNGMGSLIVYEKNLSKYKKQNPKAGKAKSAHSMILTLPKGTVLKNEIWDAITKNTFKEYYKFLVENQTTRQRMFDENDKPIMAQSYRSVKTYNEETKLTEIEKIPTIMRQKMETIKKDYVATDSIIDDLVDNTIIVKHKGNHCHTINPKLVEIEGVMVNLDYTSKKNTFMLKQIFNEMVEKYSNMNIEKHTVKENYDKAQTRQDKITKRLEAKEKAIYKKTLNYVNKKLEVKSKELELKNEMLNTQEAYNDLESAIKDEITVIYEKGKEYSPTVLELNKIVADIKHLDVLGNLGLLEMKEFSTIAIMLEKGHTERAFKQIIKIKKMLDKLKFTPKTTTTIGK